MHDVEIRALPSSFVRYEIRTNVLSLGDYKPKKCHFFKTKLINSHSWVPLCDDSGAVVINCIARVINQVSGYATVATESTDWSHLTFPVIM